MASSNCERSSTEKTRKDWPHVERSSRGHGRARLSKVEPLASLEIWRWNLLHHGGLGTDGHPLAVALREDIHPGEFAAGVFSVGGALFGVAALDHGNASHHLHIHGPKLEGHEL